MRQQQPPPMAGVLRVLFFLAVAVVGITVVVSGVTTLYDAPSGGDGGFESFNGFEEDDDVADYNRNVGLIVGLIGSGAIVIGLLGLGSRHNPLRSGLLVGGVGLVMAGVGFGAGGSDDWLVFLTSGLALLALIVSGFWLDEGLPVRISAGAPPGDAGGPRLFE